MEDFNSQLLQSDSNSDSDEQTNSIDEFQEETCERLSEEEYLSCSDESEFN